MHCVIFCEYYVSVCTLKGHFNPKGTVTTNLLYILYQGLVMIL